MRADMHEVVIERPRGGWRGKLPQPRFDGRHGHDDEVPASRASISNSRGTKYFSDLLGPLRRFLVGAVGRPWDSVYSEIREHLSPDKRLHRHILDHVAQMVQVHLQVRDAYWRPELWVCPKTGLLRYTPRCV